MSSAAYGNPKVYAASCFDLLFRTESRYWKSLAWFGLIRPTLLSVISFLPSTSADSCAQSITKSDAGDVSMTSSGKWTQKPRLLPHPLHWCMQPLMTRQCGDLRGTRLRLRNERDSAGLCTKFWTNQPISLVYSNVVQQLRL